MKNLLIGFFFFSFCGTSFSREYTLVDGVPVFTTVENSTGPIQSEAFERSESDELFVVQSYGKFKSKSEFDQSFTKEGIVERMNYLLNRRSALMVFGEDVSEIDSQIDRLVTMYAEIEK